MVRLSLL